MISESGGVPVMHTVFFNNITSWYMAFGLNKTDFSSIGCGLA